MTELPYTATLGQELDEDGDTITTLHLRVSGHMLGYDAARTPTLCLVIDPDGARYRVHMYRRGDPAADHTYEAADLDSFTAALDRAAFEVQDRGGKYGAVVWRQPQGEGGAWMKRHTGTWQVLATVAMKDVPKEAP